MIQRYRIGRITVGEAGQKAVALVEDPIGEAVLYADHVADNKALLEALKYVIGTREIKCLHFPESAPDHACAKCRADAAIAHSERQMNQERK